MTTPLTFEALQSLVDRRMHPWSDHRQAGPNTPYSIPDAARGACGLFFTPSPSFLDSQRSLPQTQGSNNARTLVGVPQIPCDNQVRNLLDPITPSQRDGVLLEVFESLAHQGSFVNCRALGSQLLIALDGPQYCSSKTMHCPHCLTRQTSNGQPRYSQTAITPVLVCPGSSEVGAFPPEDLMPQDGHDKQDCERVAGTRWIGKHAEYLAPHGVTCLGEALDSNQPLCAVARHHGVKCIFVLTGCEF
jgi:hypothetical protein